MAIDTSTNRRNTSLTGVSDATNLSQYMQEGTMQALFMQNKMMGLFRDVSEQMRNAADMIIYRDKTQHTVKTDLTATGNTLLYPTTGRGSPTLDSIKIAWSDPGYYAATNSDVTQQQMSEYPIDLLTVLANSNGRDMAIQVDTYLEECLAGLLPSTYPTAERNLWAGLLDSVDPIIGTAETDHSAVLGDSTHFVPLTGRETGDGKLILTLLEDLELLFERRNITGNASIAQTQFTVDMPPHLFASLEMSIDSRANDRFFVQRADGGEKRAWFGIFQIRSNNRLVQRNISDSTGKAITSSTNAEPCYPVYITNQQFGAAASRHDTLGMFGPGVNQAGSYWKIDNTVQHQAWPINPVYFYRRWVRVAA